MSEHPAVAEQLAQAEEELTSCLTRLEQTTLDPITQERARDNAEDALSSVRWLKTAFDTALSAAREEGRREGFEKAREMAEGVAKTMQQRCIDDATAVRAAGGRTASWSGTNVRRLVRRQS